MDLFLVGKSIYRTHFACDVTPIKSLSGGRGLAANSIRGSCWSRWSKNLRITVACKVQTEMLFSGHYDCIAPTCFLCGLCCRPVSAEGMYSSNSGTCLFCTHSARHSWCVLFCTHNARYSMRPTTANDLVKMLLGDTEATLSPLPPGHIVEIASILVNHISPSAPSPVHPVIPACGGSLTQDDPQLKAATLGQNQQETSMGRLLAWRSGSSLWVRFLPSRVRAPPRCS